MQKKLLRPLVIVLAILSAVAIRMAGQPDPSVGLLFGLLGVIFIGFLTDLRWGAFLGGCSVAAGLLMRMAWPDMPHLSAKKMATWGPMNEAFNQMLSQYWWALILVGIVLGAVFGWVGETLVLRAKKREGVAARDTGTEIKGTTQTFFTAQRIAQMALLVALGSAINSLRVGVLSFGGFPIIFSGYFLGPLGGFLTGAVTDVVAFIIRPSSSGFNPIFTITSGLTGLIPILVTHLLGQKENFTFWKVLPGVVVGQYLTSVVLVPLFMSIFIGPEPAKAQFFTMAIKQLFSAPVYAFLVVTIFEAMRRGRRVPSLK